MLRTFCVPLVHQLSKNKVETFPCCCLFEVENSLSVLSCVYPSIFMVLTQNGTLYTRRLPKPMDQCALAFVGALLPCPPPLCSFRCTSTPTHMQHLHLLGFAGGNPVVFDVDPSSPHSSISEVFLFRSDVNSLLNASGRRYQKISLSIPSLRGFYTSKDFTLLSSVVCDSDVVLGAD